MSEILQFFAYGHLPPRLQAASKLFAVAAQDLSVASLNRLASELADMLPDNYQGDRAMRKVACAVRLFTGTDQVNGQRALALDALIEAKDCAVRSILFKPGEYTIDNEGKAVAQP